jgi:hypothetical protein
VTTIKQKGEHTMFILFEKFINMLNRFTTHSTDLERYITAHNPQHGGDVDNLIKQFTYGKKEFV